MWWCCVVVLCGGVVWWCCVVVLCGGVVWWCCVVKLFWFSVVSCGIVWHCLVLCGFVEEKSWEPT